MSSLTPAAQFAAAAAASVAPPAEATAEPNASSAVAAPTDKATSEFPPVSPSATVAATSFATSFATGYAASVSSAHLPQPLAAAPEPVISDPIDSPSANAAAFTSPFASTASIAADGVASLSVASTPPPAHASPAVGGSAAADGSHMSAAAMFESAVDSAVSSDFGDNDEAPAEKAKPKRNAVAKPNASKPVDLADEELFPSLSSTAPPRPAPASWGARSGAAAATSVPANGGAVPGPQSMAQQLKLSQTTEIIDLPMMQTAVADTARKIMERTKTRIEISHNRVLNTSTYLVTGKPDNVARAKREICSKLSPRITKLLQIPASVRAQVVGVRGRALQAIQTQTGTVITLPKTAAKSTCGDGDDDIFAILDISITGDSIGVHSAIAQIEEIVSKRTTNRAMRLTDIPRPAYALLVGKNGETLQVFQQAHPGVRVRIPGPLAFDEVICLAGERSAVQAAAADLHTAARTLIEKSRSVTVKIPKLQHQFIVGSGGQTLGELMRATGCHIIVPPPRSDFDEVVVLGPEDSLVKALGMVMAKANSAVVETVDPTAIHAYGRPLLYVNRALQYFHNRNRFRRIESEHGVTLRVPSAATAAAATSPSAVLIEVQGKDARSVAAARDAVSELFVAFPPYHFNSIDVEPHLHPLLAGRDGANSARLQAARSVYTLFPSDASSRAVLVVYEGFNPDIDRIVDARTREGATRDLLRKTLEEFRTAIQSDDSHTTRTIKVPPALQRTLAEESALDALLKAANASAVAVRFGIAAPAQAEPENTRTVLPQSSLLEEDDVEVKGLAPAAEAVLAAIAARVRAHEEHQRLHSFTGDVAVPQQQMARIIGRGGENIKRIRGAHDVTIDVVDGTGSSPGVVRVRGTREGVGATVAELQAFVERMADQTSDTVAVPAAIHKSLIGTGGRYVKKLEEKYAVYIQFPSSRREAGDVSSPSLGADEILIRGGRKGVDSAKAELLELAAYEAENNHTVRFSVPADCLPHIVGRAGANINEIKDDSNTRINFGDAQDGRVEATIAGTRVGVRLAREAIEAIVSEHEAQVDVAFQVPVRHHRFLIGSQGARVRELVQGAGGNPDATTGASACRVQFPRAAENSDTIRIRGDRSIVEAVRERIEKLVAERERMTTVAVSIPVSQHAFIIGRGGAHLKQLQEEHSVEIHFRSRGSSRPEPPAEGSDPSTVRITGLPENCDSCKAALLALVRDEARLSVPLVIHQRLGGRTGSLWRRLRNEFDVQVDAASVDKAPASRIDDSPTSDVVFNDPAARLAGLGAEWVLRGEKTKLAAALDLINAQINSAGNTIEARIRVEQHLHKLVIGKQGANIARIRDASGCDISVPKRGNNSQWIVVTGDRASAERAIEMVRESIDERD
ncbi:hypothetical protein GGI22_001004 [Coemansia erecta]|nr:hypothetical protein GGI22_001004 [Coemansia erecta]